MNFDGTISLSTIVTLAIFAVTGLGVWYNTYNQVKHNSGKLNELSTTQAAVHAKMSLTERELADYKLHVSETYVSKQGNRESTEQIMAAIQAVRSSIEGTNQRLDRLYEAKPTQRRST